MVPDKKNTFYSLHTRLILMAMAVVLVPMLLATTFAFYFQKEQIHLSLNRELNASFNACKLYYQNMRERLELTTMAVAGDNTCKTTLRLGVLSQLQSQLEMLAAQYEMELLVATDASGHIMAIFPPTAAGSGDDLSRHPLLHQALQGENVSAALREEHPLLAQTAGMSANMAAKNETTAFMVLLESAVPITVRDTRVGAILAGIRLSGNMEMMQAMRQASGADHTALALPGEIIASTFDHTDGHGQAHQHLFAAIAGADTAAKPQPVSSVICPLDGKRRVLRPFTLPGLPGRPAISLITLLDYDQAGILIKEAVSRIILVFLGTMLVAAAIAFFVARSIASPINALSMAMRDMKAGAMGPVLLPVTRHDEIGALIHGYNTLSTQIQTYTQGLEEQIKERVLVEKALIDEKERLAVTLRSIGDAVITTDTKGDIVFINKVAEELTGWNNDEAQGRDVTEVLRLINNKTGAPCPNPVQQVLAMAMITTLADDTVLITRDGARRHIADSGAPILDWNNKVIGTVIVFRDITETLKIENELLKIKQLESIGVLAGGIAHDFNNSLAAILGNIEVAASRIAGKDEKTSSLLAAAQKAVVRASDLTKQLLTFAKGGSPVKDTTSLPRIIRDSADFVLHGTAITCDYHFPENLWPAEVDSGQISQVIQNIVINAWHAMPDGGMLSISGVNITNPTTEPIPDIHEGHFVKITIKDTGSGIAPELIDRIFDPYFTTKEMGNGLGLAICHSIIRKHHGYLTVQSEPGQGTTFSIYLPANPAASLTPEAAKNAPDSSAPVITSARIMVLDDEQIIRDVIKAQLAALGHETVLVADGAEAIRVYQELKDAGTPVDLVIMDLTIPGGMGGKETAQLLLQRYPDARLIVSSGYSNDPVMAHFRDYGFRGAISKPFSIDDLEKGIIQALQS